MRRLLALTLLAPLVASAAPVDYARDVLPLLSDACFRCHGPDEKERKAKLRLDTKEGLYRTEDGITVVAPGKMDESDLVVRVASKDPDEVMPPPKSNRQLKPQEIDIIKRWVAEGAPFGRHWAFESMKKPVLDGIDALVEAKLREEKLALSPEADRERLIRRVTLDLTGLPPTLEEIDAFVSDSSAPAFEKVVNRLLASPRYGERLATEWLDVARFADTHGYQMDASREMWPWRDWVIKAFNENMPFDQFTRWQLAGDLLPNATKEQKLATAFNRHHMQNEEGGIVEEEFRTAYVVGPGKHLRDRVSRADHRMRPVPRPQVRSDFTTRLLFALRFFPEHR
jgi:mono/diheme cytochrome c family protein